MRPWRSLLALPAAGALPAAAQASAAGSAQKVLRYAFRVAETGFDPAQVNDLYSRTVIAAHLRRRCSRLRLPRASGAGGQPNTAAAIPEVSRGFHFTWTVRIQPGILFRRTHPAFKGEPQARAGGAADYVYSDQAHLPTRKLKSPNCDHARWSKRRHGRHEPRSVRPRSRAARFDYDREVDGIRALDRYTFQLRFAQPNPRFYLYLADNSFLGAVAREVAERYDEKALMGHPVGTGPFRLAEWRRSSRIVLERNPGYRQEHYSASAPADDPVSIEIAARLRGQRLPIIDRVEVYIVEENQPRWLAFLNNEHDLIDELPYDLADLAIPGGQLAPALKRRNIRMERAPRANVDMALFNMEHPLVGGYAPERVALRRAIGLAYNVDDEIRLVRKGQSVPSQSPVPPTVPGYDPGFRSEMSEFSRVRARALLDAFGYVDRDGDGWRELPDGAPFALEMATQPDQLSRLLDEMWKRAMTAVGLRIDFKTAKWPENLKNSRAGKLMMWRVGWVAAQPDGDTFLALGFGPNKGQANHARFDLEAYNRLYREQRMLPDGPRREQLFHEAKKFFVAYAPYKFVGHRIETAVSHPWVIGYRRHPFMRDFWKYIDIDADVQARSA
jgi:ABC-type transport system substrate-binding protein